MKHYLIVYDNKAATATLKQLLLADDTVIVHVVESAAGIKPLLLAFPVELVFIGVGLWDYKAFKGMRHLPLLVMLCNTREFIKEELLGSGSQQLPYLKEPFFAKDIILLNIRLTKLVPLHSAHFLFIKFDRRWRKIMFEEIELIEKKDTMYSLIHTKIGNLLVLRKVEHWMAQLPPDEFIRVADGLVVTREDAKNVMGNVYTYKGREIKLSFKFAKHAKREVNKQKRVNKTRLI